jgi:hypothetical protein
MKTSKESLKALSGKPIITPEAPNPVICMKKTAGMAVSAKKDHQEAHTLSGHPIQTFFKNQPTPGLHTQTSQKEKKKAGLLCMTMR